MDLRVIHETDYRYRSPVVLSHQLLHLQPRSLPWQSVLSYRQEVEPAGSDLSNREDYFGNPVTSFTIATPHTRLRVRSESRVRVLPRAATLAGAPVPAWETIRDGLVGRAGSPLEAARFLFESPHVELLRELVNYAAPSFPARRDLLACLRDLARRIHADFKFDSTATSVATPLREVIAKQRGVCQDFAHLMIGCLRALGLSARYVSGYILTRPPPGRPRLIGADASHAWVSAYCPPLGWVDIDPTNNCFVDDEHVTLAWGRDFSDVTPLRGVILGGDDQELKVAVTVLPLGNADDPVDATHALTANDDPRDP